MACVPAAYLTLAVRTFASAAVSLGFSLRELAGAAPAARTLAR